VSGFSDLEQCGLLDIADAYRKVADLAIAAAQGYASGLPDVELRERLDAALEQVDWRVRRLEAARRGYSRLEAARIQTALYGPLLPRQEAS
jgi:hypothetical protein